MIKFLLKYPLATIGIVILGILMIACILAPYITHFNPLAIDLTIEGEPKAPSLKNLWGTDEFGRDLLTRALYGGRISLGVSFLSVAIYVTIGTIIGIISGYWGSVLDSLLMRLVDIILCIPTFFFILSLQVLLKPSLINVILVIGFTSWTVVARLIRAEVLILREKPFIESARAIGASNIRIIWAYLLPNLLPTLSVVVTLGIANVILLEAVLGFLGIGVAPPTPSWGNMLYSGRNYIEEAPWLSFFPGLLIVLTVISLNLIGDALREKQDPRLK